MSTELIGQFVRRLSTTTTVEVEFRQPINKFFVTVLFGPSGSGKSTTLRCLAGLDRPDEGAIQFGDSCWFDHQKRLFLTPQKRDVGYLFQDYALFPHLSVAKNIEYGLRGVRRDERRLKVSDMLSRFQLMGLESRYPHEISGGEQQRVALARVLARRPRLLLLDEPLSALDARTREQLRNELRKQLAEFEMPVVLVTHDRTEAMALADHLVVLDRGRICQQGPVDQVYSRPVNVEVAHIVGMGNVHSGRVIQCTDGLARIAMDKVELFALAPDPMVERVYVCINAEDVALQRGGSEGLSQRNRLVGTIVSLTSEGPLVRVELDCGCRLVALVTRPASVELALRPGDTVTALVKVPAVHLIARN